jgi:hypothetical protein
MADTAGTAPQPPPTLKELRRSLRRAIAANDAYLDDGHPAAAGTREQVKALTAQVTTLIRLTLGD